MLYEVWEERNRPESVLARNAVENALLKQAKGETIPFEVHQQEERGSRYIDFLIPGLLGMNLMGGGLFGVGFVLVDMRVRKLLKRFMATPMRRSDFLLSIMISRLLFTLPEVFFLLGFAYLAFDVRSEGALWELIVVVFIGGATFAGIGLLLACRAKQLETISGLVNLVSLPQFVLSGVFFSSERFPEVMQPIIQALPLTALIRAYVRSCWRGTASSRCCRNSESWRYGAPSLTLSHCATSAGSEAPTIKNAEKGESATTTLM